LELTGPVRVEALLALLLPKVLAWLARKGPGAGLKPEDMEDALQTICLRLLREAPAPSGATEEVRAHRLLAFGWTVVRNGFTDFLRHHRTEEQGVERSLTAEEALAGGASPGRPSPVRPAWPPAAGDDPLARLLRQEVFERVSRALWELGGQAEQVWEEHVAGAGPRAIGRKLHLPEARVKYLLHKARAHLQRRLGDWRD
jgi:RNA polymerase sigma factor (sigma-70 family)